MALLHVGTAAGPRGGDSTVNQATRVASAPLSAQRHPVTTEDQGDSLTRPPGPHHQQLRLSQSPRSTPLANTLQEQPCSQGTRAPVASCNPPTPTTRPRIQRQWDDAQEEKKLSPTVPRRFLFSSVRLPKQRGMLPGPWSWFWTGRPME
ncbi:hypothetical protein HJG60_012139 [Phyllostomus discolor]|uniref:Uncharacterized protein n=1 Tax=Phyllostomus discolor TaxID=89673 RepID=A0A833ZDV1_9CHIR|nr:hypothetical protein HJG60_012139 [Phyllostomus discolor]